ncbi:MAG TPA: DUF2007 domain-containing protein [Usitatibacteraceae bacterium]|nr:DUF2007 domain-containing protein [Usitatibacteraceae bacterium]
MKRVYNAANLPDAYIVAGYLASRGIRVRILNVNAAGAIGELPADAAAPQLWVEDPRDEARAREAIDAFQALASGPSRRCAACGEENPPAFEVCWSCGRGLEA